MKATLKTIYNKDGTRYGFHAQIKAGIYPAIGFSYDNYAEALKRATLNLRSLMEKHEGSIRIAQLFANIHQI